MSKKKFKDTRFAKFFGGLIRNAAQTVPVLGTLVTAHDTARIDPSNENSKMKLTGWHWLRIGLGLVIGWLLYKGIINQETIDQINTIIDSLTI